MIRIIENHKKPIVFLFFLIFLLIGLNIFKDYGVHWDEYYNQDFGRSFYQYIRDVIRGGASDFSEYMCKYIWSHYYNHGPFFELFLAFVQKDLLNLYDSRDILFMRHLFTFLLFYLAVFFFYLLCKSYFKSWKIGILGSLFLILHPRILAHSFYNSTDISFLSFYIISTYTLIRLLEKKAYPRAFFHALTCAILIDIRIVGGILPLCTFIFSGADLWKLKKDRQEINKIVKTITVYIILLVALTFLFWPLIWKDAIGVLLKSLKNSLTLRHHLYYPPSPWYYNLKWIIVTTPLLYSFCFIVGFLVSWKALFKNPIKLYFENRSILIALFLFSLPIILPMICKPILYDGWRHHYFVYPLFLIFSLLGLQALFKFIKTRFQGLSYRIVNGAFIFIIVASLGNIVWFMVKCHPHQYVYANILAGKEMRRAKYVYALDYWGLSYREALEYILETDKRKTIKVCAANMPGRTNAHILPPDERKRLSYVEDVGEADYFLANYRSTDRYKYKWHQGEYPRQEEYYSLQVGEAKFMVVYKVREVKNHLPIPTR